MAIITGLYDSVARRYISVVVNHNDKAAIREFKNAYANAYGDSSNFLFVNPGDFDLYKLADFDSELGIIDNCVQTCLAKGLEVYNLVDAEISYGEQEEYE